MSFAPVLIIGFNRFDHFCETFNALSENKEARNTLLFVSIDGPVTKYDSIQQVLISEYVNKNKNKFKKINFKINSKNIGLEQNITKSISEIIKKYKKLIILEDDIVVSLGFLSFMNKSLDYYENEKKVWHIAAHTEINDLKKPNEFFFWPLMNCWGWATWSDRWAHYQRNPSALRNNFSKQDISKFDLNHSGLFWSQVVLNEKGLLNTWAVFWYATIFKNSGLCINPYFSFSRNIGFDGSGVHCGASSYDDEQKLNHFGIFTPPKIIEENKKILKLMQNHYKKKYTLKRRLKFLLQITFGVVYKQLIEKLNLKK